jgi:hypothetical protein
MEYDKILTVPTGGTDSATAMAMMNNNPWMYLVMLALFGGGGFGFGNGRGAGVAANGVLDMETQNKLNSLQAQINDNNNNQWAREAITGVGERADFAISQLSQNIGVGVAELRNAIGAVNAGIAQLGAQNGMGFAGVTNAINLGNLNLVQQLKDCCCGLKTQVLEQGYQGRIETINQTNDLLTGMRVENGLTRAEMASFRQAWENARYQDVVAEKTRLQTELDLLRSQNGTAAMMAPMQAELQKLEWQMQNFFSTYNGAKTAQAAS